MSPSIGNDRVLHFCICDHCYVIVSRGRELFSPAASLIVLSHLLAIRKI